MALISLSDWLDRFGDADPRPAETGSPDPIRFAAIEVEERGVASARRQGLRQRLDQALRRAFWRFRRQPAGSA